MPKVRLHVEAPLAAGARLVLDAMRAHYVATVMRLGAGATLALFNGRDGEWAAEIVQLRRNRVILEVGKQLRAQAASSDLWLVFAPVKRARIDLIAEKATELGVGRLVPVLTAFTSVDRVNLARLAATAREAAEQCGRLDVPEVAEPESFARLMGAWPAERRLVFCDERGAPPAAEVMAGLEPGPSALLVGPEGGFSDAEAKSLRGMAQVLPVSLGPRKLRAETAAIAALALYQALCGDGRETADG